MTRASRQPSPDPVPCGRWREPRYHPDDLLYFFDVNVWHRRCVLLKALLVGGLGWRLERAGEPVLDPARGTDRLPDSPATRLLRRPSAHPGATLGDLAGRLLVDFYATGNAYLEVVRDGLGRPAELYHVPARTVRRDPALDAYWQTRGARSVRLPAFGHGTPGASELLHLLQYDPADEAYGAPDWLAALGAMGLDRSILEFNTRLFANSLMAHTAVVVEGGRLSDAGRDALRTYLAERATGTANAGRVLLIEDDRPDVRIRFEKLNLDVKDLVIVEAQRHFRDVVLAAHGVPPRVLGITTPGQLGATGEVEGQLRTFRETVLRPGRQLLESTLALVLGLIDPALRLVFDEMDVTDLRADGEYFARLVAAGILTPEEAAARLPV